MNIHGIDYYCIFAVNKTEAINLFRNADLSEKSGSLSNKFFMCRRRIKDYNKFRNFTIPNTQST